MDAERECRLRSRLASAIRIVQMCVATGLLWKIQFFLWSDKVYIDYRLIDSFFPDWLESQWTLRIAFVTAVLSSIATVFAPRRTALVGRVVISIVIAELLALSVLVLHQGSYNDVTFLTSWWAIVWCLWGSSQLHVADAQDTCRRAKRLACVIVSLVLLGAATGKWTSEYWSGTVLHEIYFRERDFWLFNLLRERFEKPELLTIAMWYSRTVIVVETVAGFTLWCLPTRIAGWIGLILMLLIPLTNNFHLFSVTLSLVGLSCAAILLSMRDAKA
jgi:hypothetical protein